jgi:hypothetical protein
MKISSNIAFKMAASVRINGFITAYSSVLINKEWQSIVLSSHGGDYKGEAAASDKHYRSSCFLRTEGILTSV